MRYFSSRNLSLVCHPSFGENPTGNASQVVWCLAIYADHNTAIRMGIVLSRLVMRPCKTNTWY